MVDGAPGDKSEVDKERDTKAKVYHECHYGCASKFEGGLADSPNADD